MGYGRKPKTCIQAGEVVDEYEHARCEEEQRYYYPVDGKADVQLVVESIPVKVELLWLRLRVYLSRCHGSDKGEEKTGITGRNSEEGKGGVVLNPLGDSEEESRSKTMSQEQRRQMRRELGSKEDSPDGCSSSINITAEKLNDLHLQDETLAAVRALAQKASDSRGEFFKRNELLYRRWTPTGRGEEMEVKPLVKGMSTSCTGDVSRYPNRRTSRQTRQRLLCRFFWPSTCIFSVVDKYCKSCSTCQKASFKGVKPAPMIPLPIVSEPFSRIAMDIVGPLPRSRAGNKYILVLCDYTTRYPEAVPLKSIDAESVAEELIKIFATIGVPSEILTDQGANFTSQLLAELYKHLQGPYQVLRRVGKVNYLIDMLDKRKRKRVFHVNMLKDFHIREAGQGCLVEDVQEGEDEIDIPPWHGDNSRKKFDLTMGEELVMSVEH
ncbi:hypothetical protein EMCRGX_G009525 [Ephydatia muelleri]